MTRSGERIGQAAAASFRCAACGEMAGVVKVARAGTIVEIGPPAGPQTYDRDAIVVDHFLGTASKFAMPPPWTPSRRSSAATHLTRQRSGGSTGSWHPFTALIAT
jgi:hypothetical protein